jgi:hypothetical protein
MKPLSVEPSTPGTTPEVYTLSISEIVRERDLQVRRKLDPPTINRYTNALAAGADMPPITVAEVNGALVLIDGWHRLAAMDALGWGEADAVVIPGVTPGEARWRAAAANLTHGLPLKPKEVREVFRAYIKAQKHVLQHGSHGSHRATRSYREIAQDLGGLVSYGTVRAWMIVDFPRIAAAMGGNESYAVGGLVETSDPETLLVDSTSKALDQATAAARGVNCPRLRGDLVRKAEETLEAIRSGGPWDPAEVSDF